MTAAPKLEPSATGVNSSRHSSSLQREPAANHAAAHHTQGVRAGHKQTPPKYMQVKNNARASSAADVLLHAGNQACAMTGASLTKGLAEVLAQELAPVVVLEEHAAVHRHHQAPRVLHPVLQAQHCNQQAGCQAGATACHQPADGLDLQTTQEVMQPAHCQPCSSTKSHRSRHAGRPVPFKYCKPLITSTIVS